MSDNARGVSDNELGVLLRTRREALTPADVGLPEGTHWGARRRTPGLRRAELAMLAGVSVEYLTRLEQGRDRHPSPQVVVALADALRLSPAERELLFHTAKANGGAICPTARPASSDAVRPTVRAVLDQLAPAPAVVLNPVGDLLAWTTGYLQLAVPVGLLDPPGQAATDPPPANLLRFLFTDPRARTAYPDWDQVATEQVAHLRSLTRFGYQTATALAEELAARAGMPFTQRYQAPAQLPAQTGLTRWCHPDLGELRLAYETLTLPGPEEQRLVVYLPADGTTETALEKLTSR